MEIKKRIEIVNERIRAAALRSGRSPEAVRLVAVSKTKPAEKVRAAHAAGAGVFGENYIQEARKKIEELEDLAASWHFIGHLQTNKAKYAVRLFDLIHSVDSFRLAERINEEAARIDKVQPVLIQVNISGEAAKSGVCPEESLELVRSAAGLAHLSVQGLMTMPPFFDDPENARPFFAALAALRRNVLEKGVVKTDFNELSMGMTGDFEAAVEEGATLVRVGTAIFGERQ